MYKILIWKAPIIISNKCPANILILNRKPTIKGRKKIVKHSIIIKKGNKVIGAPEGTKCLKNFLKSILIIIIILENQYKKEKVKFKNKIVVKGKIYLDILKKLKKKRIINKNINQK